MASGLVVKPNFVCRQAGFLPGRIGDFFLGARPLPLKIAEQTSLVDQRTGRCRFDGLQPGEGLAKIREFALLPSPSAVVIKTTRLPIDVVSPFEVADRGGGHYTAELEEQFDNVVFLPQLEFEGRWVGGFVESEKDPQIPECVNPPKVMFLNLFGPKGMNEPIPGEEFYEIMAPLLGRAVIETLVIASGLSLSSLSDQQKRAFIESYARSMRENIDSQFTR